MLLQDKPTDMKQFQHLSFEEFDAAPSPRVLKSHYASSLLPGTHGGSIKEALPQGMKVVIVSRNPYDACVSGYYHFGKPTGIPFEGYATAWLNGMAEYGSYFDWIKQWYHEYKTEEHLVSVSIFLWWFFPFLMLSFGFSLSLLLFFFLFLSASPGCFSQTYHLDSI
jgi:hypothetical protein